MALLRRLQRPQRRHCPLRRGLRARRPSWTCGLEVELLCLGWLWCLAGRFVMQLKCPTMAHADSVAHVCVAVGSDTSHFSFDRHAWGLGSTCCKEQKLPAR